MTTVVSAEEPDGTELQLALNNNPLTASTIAMLNDTCGNLIQLTQLARH